MELRIIRSKRKTLSLSLSRDGVLIVRAPLFLSDEIIEKELEKASDSIKKWVERYEKTKNKPMNREISAEEEAALRKKARETLIPMVEKYGNIMGLHPTYVKITSARTRFGSCNSKNGICFSYRLALYPREAMEAVVVHELAHIKHKNHGKAFYALVRSVLPDYNERKELL